MTEEEEKELLVAVLHHQWPRLQANIVTLLSDYSRNGKTALSSISIDTLRLLSNVSLHF